MPDPKVVTACVLVIGNEILSGRTEDRNINFLARRLTEIGVRLKEVRVIPDDHATIVATVNAVRGPFDYVITTGGIGPTHDDITTECVAAAFGLATYVDDAVVALMQSFRPDRPMNEARKRMATFPVGAELIQNPVSAAPGYRIGNVFVLAGVPEVMQAMFDSAAHHFAGGDKVLSRSVRVMLAEGDIAEGLGRLQQRYPDVDIGSYPAMRQGRFGVSVVLRATDPARLGAAFDALVALLGGLGGEPREETLAGAAPETG